MASDPLGTLEEVIDFLGLDLIDQEGIQVTPFGNPPFDGHSLTQSSSNVLSEYGQSGDGGAGSDTAPFALVSHFSEVSGHASGYLLYGIYHGLLLFSVLR